MTARKRKRDPTAPFRVAPGLYTLGGYTVRRESRHGGVWGDWSIYHGGVMVDWARTLAEAAQLVRDMPDVAYSTPRVGASRAFGNTDRLLVPAEKVRRPRYGRGEIAGCPY